MTNSFLVRLGIIFFMYFLSCAFVSYSEEITDDDDDDLSESDSLEDFTCNSGRPQIAEYNSDNCFPVLQKISEFGEIVIKNMYFESTSNINAYLECMSCIAIVNELSKAVCLHMKNYKKLKHNMREENFPCYPDLVDICAHKFISYDLQENESMKRLAPSSFNGKHVPVQNINWKQKLEDLCLVYVAHYGIENIYDEWLTNSEPGLVDELCNKTGIFGSCQAIECDETYDFE